MKKIIIIFLSLILSFSAQADERSQKEKCQSITKYTNHWYYNNCDELKIKDAKLALYFFPKKDLKVKTSKNIEIIINKP